MVDIPWSFKMDFLFDPTPLNSEIGEKGELAGMDVQQGIPTELITSILSGKCSTHFLSHPHSRLTENELWKHLF